jgi:hypothetical protein
MATGLMLCCSLPLSRLTRSTPRPSRYSTTRPAISRQSSMLGSQAFRRARRRSVARSRHRPHGEVVSEVFRRALTGMTCRIPRTEATRGQATRACAGMNWRQPMGDASPYRDLFPKAVTFSQSRHRQFLRPGVVRRVSISLSENAPASPRDSWRPPSSPIR